MTAPPHRASYAKTTALAACIALAAAALPALAVWGAGPLDAWGPGAWAAWSTGAAVAAGLALTAGLVAGGGLAALRRDSREERGVPYPPGRREATRGPARGVLFAVWRALRSPVERRAGMLHLRPGEWVEVRALGEILATLDARGCVEGVPFMPEMVPCCGRAFRVARRAETIYDWIRHTGLRRLRAVVQLEGERCDGSGHGGCQAACALLWKEAWLRRRSTPPHPGVAAGPTRLCEGDLAVLARGGPATGPPRYSCQVTALPEATTPVSWNDPRPYLRDLLTGNVRLRRWLVAVALALFNRVQRWRGGVQYPARATTGGRSSPHAELGLRPGELVRVKSKREIAATLTARSRNRGLWFDRDMVRYCGGTYRVAARVERLIDERSGALVRLANPCIILDGVTATGEYLGLSATDESIFWREIWLERVREGTRDATGEG